MLNFMKGGGATTTTIGSKAGSPSNFVSLGIVNKAKVSKMSPIANMTHGPMPFGSIFNYAQMKKGLHSKSPNKRTLTNFN